MCGTEIEARRALETAIRTAGDEGRGWWVLNSIPLRESGNSDADVVVGIPNVGVLILEVKGWRTFVVDTYGQWSRPGPGGRTEDMGDGPFVQAQRQEYLMLELLTRSLKARSLPAGRLPLIGSGVLFGNLTEGEVDQQGWANDSRFCLFRDTFCPHSQLSKTEAVLVLNRLRNLLRANSSVDKKRDNSPRRLEDIRVLLAPTRRVSGLAAFVMDSREAINQLAETAMSEKAEVLNSNSLYVEGAAGTGKTILALQLGLHRSRLLNKPSLYLCYSQRLAEEIRSVEQYGAGTVLVYTPEELLATTAGSEKLTPFEETEMASVAAAKEVAELTGLTMEPMQQPRAYLGTEQFWDVLVTALAVEGREFAAVLVDEAQDLWDPAFEYLSAIAGSDSLFAVFADPSQTTRRERAGISWAQPDATIGGKVLQLRRNFRNGDRIVEAVEERFSIGYEPPPRGHLPAELRLLPYTNADPLPKVVKREWDDLRLSGLDPVVLETGLSTEQRTALSSYEIDTYSVDSFKGLERTSIILVLGTHRSPLDPNDEDLYVGMTRANVLLSLVFHASHAPIRSSAI